MRKDKKEHITTVAMITRRLKKGKTYDDFRRAWFHTTGFGVGGKNKGGSNNMTQPLPKNGTGYTRQGRRSSPVDGPAR